MSVAIWLAYNGWHGNGAVGCLVQAETEAGARVAASEAFAASSGGQRHGPEYAIVETVELIELPWIGEIE